MSLDLLSPDLLGVISAHLGHDIGTMWRLRVLSRSLHTVFAQSRARLEEIVLREGFELTSALAEALDDVALQHLIGWSPRATRLTLVGLPWISLRGVALDGITRIVVHNCTQVQSSWYPDADRLETAGLLFYPVELKVKGLCRCEVYDCTRDDPLFYPGTARCYCAECGRATCRRHTALHCARGCGAAICQQCCGQHGAPLMSDPAWEEPEYVCAVCEPRA